MNVSRRAFLGLIAALASLAVAGVTASPAAAVTKLCTKNELNCTVANTWTIGTVLNGNATNNKFIIETTVEGKPLKLEVTCTESETGGVTEDDKGLPFEVTFLVWSGCTGAGKPCTVNSANSPRGGLMTATGGGNGTLSWIMSYTISCVESKVFCKAGAGVTLDHKGGLPAQLLASNEVFKKEEDPKNLNCPATVTWATATYTTSKTAFLTN